MSVCKSRSSDRDHPRRDYCEVGGLPLTLLPSSTLERIHQAHLQSARRPKVETAPLVVGQRAYPI
jgi:hypothetical protein